MNMDVPKSNKLLLFSGAVSKPTSLMALAKRALIMALLFNLCLVSLYIVFTYQVYFHSDSAAKNLLAQEIYETGKYFPPHWYYANADLWVLFGHTYILPLLLFFPNSFSLHAVAGVLGAGLVLIGTWCVAGVTSKSPWDRLVAVIVVSSGISGVMAENLFGQVSYGTVYYFTCFIIFFAWRFLDEESRLRWRWGTGTVIITGLVFWANPQRALVSYGLPLTVAGIIYVADELRQSGGFWNSRATRGLSLLKLIFIGAMTGIALHSWIMRSVRNVSGSGSARWLPVDGMLKNVGYTLEGILAMLGGTPTSSRRVISPLGAYEAIHLVSALVLIVLLPYGLVLSLRNQNKGMRFFSVFTLVSASLVFFLQITTTIPDMADPVQSARYLVPSLLLLLILFIAQVFGGNLIRYSQLVGAMAIFTLATSSFTSLLTVGPTYQLFWGNAGQLQNNKSRLLDFLQLNGLRYGYANYWNAGVVSILSAQQIRIRQILIHNGLPVPMRHLSSERWYHPSAWIGETFLLLTDHEASMVDWDLLATYHGKPTRKLKFEEWQIYIYPTNIANSLPNWYENFGEPMVGALPPTGFKAKLEPRIDEISLSPGKRSAVVIQVSNIGDIRWSSAGEEGRGGGLNAVLLAYSIKTADGGTVIIHDGLRTTLPGNLMPGQDRELVAAIVAPQQPGKYLIEFDMVQEGVSWFSNKGSNTALVRLNVDG